MPDCHGSRVARLGLWHHQRMMQGDGKPGWVQPTDEAVLHASKALVALVAAHLPQRFYREHPWRMAGAAMIVRMSNTVESMMALMSGRYAIDT
jgi:hypothetical protein